MSEGGSEGGREGGGEGGREGGREGESEGWGGREREGERDRERGREGRKERESEIEACAPSTEMSLGESYGRGLCGRGDLIASSIWTKYSVGPSIRPICTRR